MKSLLLILLVVAINPPTSIFELAPNKIPLGLSSIKFPLELKVPNISEPIPPVTRLRLYEFEEGI